MKIRKFVLMSIVFLVLVGETRAGAYTGRDFLNDLVDPGRRRGLTIHFDVGAGASRVTAEHESWDPQKYEGTEGGTGWLVGVGYAPLDQFIIHGTLRAFSFGERGLLGLVLGPFGAALSDHHSMAGIGASIYARRSIPSWFLMAGYGRGYFSGPFDDETPGHVFDGPGFFTGVGYEFTRYRHCKIEFMWSKNAESQHAEEGKWTCATVWVTLGFVIY